MTDIITQDETGRVTISIPEFGLEAHMSPEVLAVLARQDPLEPRHVYGDAEPVPFTLEQFEYLAARGKGWPGIPLPQLSASTKRRYMGGLWLDVPPQRLPRPKDMATGKTANQRKRQRKRLRRGQP